MEIKRIDNHDQLPIPCIWCSCENLCIECSAVMDKSVKTGRSYLPAIVPGKGVVDWYGDLYGHNTNQ